MAVAYHLIHNNHSVVDMASEAIVPHDADTVSSHSESKRGQPYVVGSNERNPNAYEDDEKKEPRQEEEEILDNLFPFPPLRGIPDEEQQLSVRALVIGCALGAIVSASNIYLGLKTGWTFGASLFGSILGFAILKPLSRLTGGYFGPKVRR